MLYLVNKFDAFFWYYDDEFATSADYTPEVPPLACGWSKKDKEDPTSTYHTIIEDEIEYI